MNLVSVDSFAVLLFFLIIGYISALPLILIFGIVLISVEIGAIGLISFLLIIFVFIGYAKIGKKISEFRIE